MYVSPITRQLARFVGRIFFYKRFVGKIFFDKRFVGKIIFAPKAKV